MLDFLLHSLFLPHLVVLYFSSFTYSGTERWKTTEVLAARLGLVSMRDFSEPA